jgi:hypothetical protein
MQRAELQQCSTLGYFRILDTVVSNWGLAESIKSVIANWFSLETVVKCRCRDSRHNLKLAKGRSACWRHRTAMAAIIDRHGYCHAVTRDSDVALSSGYGL